MIGYKLVDQDGYARRGLPGETHWEVSTTMQPVGEGGKPCGPSVLHYYRHPLMAALLNPIHAAISNPRLLVIEHDGEDCSDGLKHWTTAPCRVLREEPLPEISTAQRVRWAILAARETLVDTRWCQWADAWLTGADRSQAAAMTARAAARAAAAWAAAWAATRAAAAAAAGWAAVEAAIAAPVAAPAAAARAVAWAAADAAATEAQLIELAERAIKEEA